MLSVCLLTYHIIIRKTASNWTKEKHSCIMTQLKWLFIFHFVSRQSKYLYVPFVHAGFFFYGALFVLFIRQTKTLYQCRNSILFWIKLKLMCPLISATSFCSYTIFLFGNILPFHASHHAPPPSDHFKYHLPICSKRYDVRTNHCSRGELRV